MTKCPNCLRVGCDDPDDCETFGKTLPCILFFSEEALMFLSESGPSGNYYDHETKSGESFKATAIYTYDEEKRNNPELYGYLWKDAKSVTILKNGRESIVTSWHK